MKNLPYHWGVSYLLGWYGRREPIGSNLQSNLKCWRERTLGIFKVHSIHFSFYPTISLSYHPQFPREATCRRLYRSRVTCLLQGPCSAQGGSHLPALESRKSLEKSSFFSANEVLTTLRSHAGHPRVTKCGWGSTLTFFCLSLWSFILMFFCSYLISKWGKDAFAPKNIDNTEEKNKHLIQRGCLLQNTDLYPTLTKPMPEFSPVSKNWLYVTEEATGSEL